MRTSTKFLSGNNEEFKKILENYYPAGKITVIAQDKEEGENLARQVGRDYSVSLFSSSDEIPDQGARFVIGVGGSGVIPAVKRAAKNGKYAFIPAVFDYRFLYDFGEIYSLPEFVFLNENALSESKDFTLRLYVTIFQLYAERVFSSFYRSAFPYTDKEGAAYIEQGKKLLKGEESKEEFYAGGLRFVTNTVNSFFAEKVPCLITEKMSDECGKTSAERFQAVYFLLLTLKNFTKYPFRDILLPSEILSCERKKTFSPKFDCGILPTDEEMLVFKEKVGFLTDLPDADVSALLRGLKVCGRKNVVFSIINDKGITDELYYERPEKDKRIFV